ncbi:hypothetical protein [Ferrimonas balearica]|uniref:hypothetical protein n=1 Tax=Ferrimonas balearica TaxID=44012 RepID=UPI001F3F3E70|nr:hypothetical protein [Ferrimonas balearica]MBY6019795.1 hypothetical protein [Halomonas denitrificans]MBY6096862.1 hypothetical protein [Ferrimonas balearica]
MKIQLAGGLALILLMGCQSNNVMEQFALGGTTASVKQMEILDPDASRRDEGRINDLDGQYGDTVMDNYRKSAYEPKSARGNLSRFGVGRGGGNN